MLLQVASKKETLKNVTNYIADVICKRGELGYSYGVILIPEGLIDFIPEVTRTLVYTSFFTLMSFWGILVMLLDNLCSQKLSL